jgi:hypothetical protein
MAGETEGKKKKQRIDEVQSNVPAHPIRLFLLMLLLVLPFGVSAGNVDLTHD